MMLCERLKITRATYAILDKAGHSLSWEQPELFSALVKDWIRRVEHHVE
jgi:pimeloyl-ACP methyl ester carboxylesterase